MKILVTGGSGFVGTHLVRELLYKGHDVRIFDRRPSPEFGDLVTRGDVRDEEGLNAAVRTVDAVYHLAAEHRDDVSPTSRYYDVNVEGTVNVVGACQSYGVEHLIFISSIAVYGLNVTEPDEGTPPEPTDDYGRSKLLAEEKLCDWARKRSDRSLWIIRPAVVFGSGHTGNVQTLIQQIEAGRFVMVGDGRNRKSMCYVRNLVDFLTRYSLHRDAGIRLINFADKPDLTMNELVAFAREELDRDSERLIRVPYVVGLLGGYVFDCLSVIGVGRIPFSSERVRKFCADTRVACSALDEIGFEPPYSIREGLRRTIHQTVSDRDRGTRHVPTPGAADASTPDPEIE